MSLQSTLEKLAAEHLEAMAAVGWEGLAKSLNNRGRGETFGCEIDDVYFDVGDNFRWEEQIGGPIRLTAFVVARGQRVERSRLIEKTSD